MRSPGFWSFLLFLVPSGLSAQEAYTVKELKQPAPTTVAPEISAVLNPVGYQILNPQGKPFAEIWLRKSVPASAKPAGAKGVIQFPFLAESELLGVIHLVTEAHDYRDQTVAAGDYTLRYGLQPVNGDHLGVSPFRDYSLLLPIAKDKNVAILPRKQLETQSSESTGSSHPGILFMLAVPATSSATTPAMIRDEEKNTWRVVLPLQLSVKEETKPVALPVSIIVVGASEAA